MPHITFSHSEKYIAEQRGLDNLTTDTTEQVTSGVKLNLKEIQTTFCGSLLCHDRSL